MFVMLLLFKTLHRRPMKHAVWFQTSLEPSDDRRDLLLGEVLNGSVPQNGIKVPLRHQQLPDIHDLIADVLGLGPAAFRMSDGAGVKVNRQNLLRNRRQEKGSDRSVSATKVEDLLSDAHLAGVDSTLEKMGFAPTREESDIELVIEPFWVGLDHPIFCELKPQPRLVYALG